MLVLGVLLAVGVVAAVAAGYALARWPTLDPGAPGGAVRRIGEEVERDVEREVRAGFLRRRLDPQAATGLALTLAIAVVVLGGAVLAALAFIARSNAFTLRIDRGVANWAGTNATDLSTTVLKAVTQLGSSLVVITLAVVLVVAVAATTPASARRRTTLTVAAYVATVVVGQNLISNTIKYAVDRARPSFHPLAGFSGPSFPSGHTTAAFACYCAFAVVLGRGRGPIRQRELLAGAIGIATMVGTTRVMLGVHWLTDVIAGAALGLAWFALTTIAFGGRILRFGTPVIAGRRAARLATGVEPSERRSSPPGSGLDQGGELGEGADTVVRRRGVELEGIHQEGS
jgi:undecaprenyl-diphosphatase